MKAYADTSFLVRLLVRDADNAAADAAHRKIGGPFLIYTPYHNLEVTNALRLRTFMAGHGSGPATKRQAKREEAEVLRRLKNCLTTGRFLDSTMPWEAATDRAVRLSEDHCHRLGVRGFDILHVAAALEWPGTDFITCDLRRAALAKAAGLKVTLVQRTK